ncbi:MAG: hypothetical protein NDI94_03190 [Candidatus Woesearchaeota archaeon]|nr:hypothetical protein [Candidatus Woesearchaeota archaeon]
MDLDKMIQHELEGKAFFYKYPESMLDKSKIFPFVDSNQPPWVIEAETNRSILLGLATGAGIMIPNTTPMEQVAYLSEKFRLSGTIDIKFYDPKNPGSYSSIVNSLEDRSLHVMHPYDTFNHSKYAVDPSILFFLNNKANLGTITNDAPKRKVFNLDEIGMTEGLFNQALEDMFGSIPSHIAVKLLTGAAGDGVYKGETDKLDIKRFSKGAASIVIEEFIHSIANYNIQYFIGSDGRIHFLGFGMQDIGKNGEYNGTTCMLSEVPPEGLLVVAYDACQKVALHGYKGFLGFDILEDYNGKYYPVDANIRPNASTAPYLVKKDLMDMLGKSIHVGSADITASSPDDVIKTIENHGGILFSMSSMYQKSKFKTFVLFGGSDESEARENYYLFKEAAK